MRKVHLELWAFVLLMSAGPVFAQEVADQEQPVIDITVGGLAVGGYYHQDLGQVFTAGVAASLVGIEVPLDCDPTGTVSLQIFNVLSGVPTGAALSSVSVPSSAFPYSYPTSWPPSLRRINLATPVSLSAGQQYAFTISADGSCGLFQGPLGDPYVGGDGFFIDDVNRGFSSAWYPIGPPRADLPFRTIVETVAPKVSIHHRNKQWICVNAAALGAHMAHGDSIWFRGCSTLP